MDFRARRDERDAAGPILAYSAPGTALWSGLLAVAGYALGANYGRVAGYLDPVANLVVGTGAAVFVLRIVWRWWHPAPLAAGEPQPKDG